MSTSVNSTTLVNSRDFVWKENKRNAPDIDSPKQMGKILIMEKEEMMGSCRRDYKKLMKNCNPVLYGMGKRMKNRMKSSWKIVTNISNEKFVGYFIASSAVCLNKLIIEHFLYCVRCLFLLRPDQVISMMET